jgi:hypothetical protein
LEDVCAASGKAQIEPIALALYCKDGIGVQDACCRIRETHGCKDLCFPRHFSDSQGCSQRVTVETRGNESTGNNNKGGMGRSRR